MTYTEFNKLSNRDKLKFNLPAITAYCNGECVQYLNGYKTDDWGDIYDNDENRFTGFMFRIKPKTIKKWCNIYWNKPNLWTHLYANKQEADSNTVDRIASVEIEVPVEV